ncbi:Polysaccharide deacetylase [Bacillus subtilis]|uniref:Polysaccharide deacetylase n=1 Tax=Bacillus subtilis TaxID=1423 RepID=A0AAP1E1D1_BACIU|nr:Polysaccharide deacetylase [Bacillus subtilis]
MKRLFLSIFLLGSCLALAACADQEANAEQPMPKAEQKKPEKRQYKFRKKKTIHPHGSKQRNRQSCRF